MKNYFNYFTEVEEYFTRKRGKNLLVSPLDWCLIELWRDSGIPLHVVLRGIDRSFEGAEKRRKKAPLTLYYCHPAIIEAFEEYTEAMVGASNQQVEEAPGEFSPDEVMGFLTELEGRLNSFSGEVFVRAVERVAALRSELSSRRQMDYQEVDRDLSGAGTMLAEALMEQLGKEKLKELRSQVRQETRLYRKRLSKEMSRRLEQNYLERKVLALHNLPEFTLLAIGWEAP